jgi:hypothetical protein
MQFLPPKQETSVSPLLVLPFTKVRTGITIISQTTESFEASLFLSGKNTFKDSIHYRVVIVIGHAPGKVSVRVLLLPCG